MHYYPPPAKESLMEKKSITKEDVAKMTQEERMDLASKMYSPVKICRHLPAKEHNDIIRKANPKWTDEQLKNHLVSEIPMQVVYAGEEMPEKIVKSIFLAGPTPRDLNVPSWRPYALELLEKFRYDGIVFIPEPRSGEFTSNYDDQVNWEERFLNVADCIVFWVPRDLEADPDNFPRAKMPAFTTNVEFGAWADSGKIVFGAPPDAPKNSYLKHYAEQYNVPVTETLPGTLWDAISMLENGAERTGGERFVPLFVWKTDSFQSWYKAQTEAGNRLDEARLLYTFRPRFKSFVFIWVMKVKVFVTSENRFKENEFVLTRPDISSVLLYSEVESPQGDGIVDYEVVLVKEFRSPSSTKDGFIRELPGGSSFKKEDDAMKVAAEEVHEETGFLIDPSRLEKVAGRQVAGTFSAHKSHLFKAHLTFEEMNWFKGQEGIMHGNIADSEQTFIEVHNVYDLAQNNLVDWATLGMILSALA
jgi:8-oxo-dGTP pyrophosphatase MutT (NUDIX family)